MGNSKPKLSSEEKHIREKVIEYYNKLTYSIYNNKIINSNFNEIIKNMKIKSMSIGYCVLKFCPASLVVDNAVHAYAFFELDIPQKYILELFLNKVLTQKKKLEKIIFLALFILMEMD